MILSAGLTPAWQQTLVFDSFRYGEVNRAKEAVWFAAGKVVNAGLAAHHLGGPSLTLAPLGGPALAEIDREFGELGAPRRWVETEAATRVCTTILDRSDPRRLVMTELVENGRPLSEQELERFRRAYAEEAARADAVVIIGSLPAAAPKSFYRELLERTSCPAVLDCWGEAMLATLDLEPYCVKPNREELANTLGRTLHDNEELVEAMMGLNDLGAGWVLVTEGARSVWLTSPLEAYRFDPPAVEQPVNPIGCGDAVAGTIAWSLRDGRDMIEAVRLAIAAAGENLRQLLPGRLDRATVERRAEEVRVVAL